VTIQADTGQAGVSMAGVSMAGVSMAGVSMAGVSMAGVSLAGVSLAGVSLAGARRERARRRRRNAEQEHRDEVYRQWLAAEAATNGYLLNRAGQRSGIDERSLFTGPESRVLKYASAELIEWFQCHPRPTRVWWFGSAATRRAHLAGRRIG
jgi:hypothetical protein